MTSGSCRRADALGRPPHGCWLRPPGGSRWVLWLGGWPQRDAGPASSTAELCTGKAHSAMFGVTHLAPPAQQPLPGSSPHTVIPALLPRLPSLASPGRGHAPGCPGPDGAPARPVPGSELARPSVPGSGASAQEERRVGREGGPECGPTAAPGPGSGAAPCRPGWPGSSGPGSRAAAPDHSRRGGPASPEGPRCSPCSPGRPAGDTRARGASGQRGVKAIGDTGCPSCPDRFHPLSPSWWHSGTGSPESLS